MPHTKSTEERLEQIEVDVAFLAQALMSQGTVTPEQREELMAILTRRIEAE